MYDVYKDEDILYIISAVLIDEARALETISKNPHPGIIRYHGCRVRRGRITGLVLDRHGHDLNHYHKDSIGPFHKDAFMDALEAAVHHLHSLGLAHNDINPANILVNDAGLPVLVDFGASREIGMKLTFSRGTPAWIDEAEDYTTSEKRHDTFAIEKIRAWLDRPTFDC